MVRFVREHRPRRYCVWTANAEEVKMRWVGGCAFWKFHTQNFTTSQKSRANEEKIMIFAKYVITQVLKAWKNRQLSLKFRKNF